MSFKSTSKETRWSWVDFPSIEIIWKLYIKMASIICHLKFAQLGLVSTQNHRCFNHKFCSCFIVDKLTFFRRWNTVISSKLIQTLQFLKHYNIRTKIFSLSTQNQRYFNVKLRRWLNVDKLTLFRSWNTVIISTFR